MKTQTDDDFFLINGQGFIKKLSYKSYDTHFSIQISYPTKPMQKFLWISIKTSGVSLIEQMSQQIQSSNDMQCLEC
jgi:pyrimidine operon attenuation protein/uracil phosphoribosyltransferase